MRHSVRAGSKILRHSCVVGSYGFKAVKGVDVWLKTCPHLTLAATLYVSYEDMAGPARTVAVP